MLNQKLLILDIDETLIHATETAINRKEEFKVDQYFVYKRPGLDQFLQFCLDHFKVAIWTSSTMLYALEIVNNIISDPKKLGFLWARERCTQRANVIQYKYEYIKNLKKVKKLGYPLEQVIVVDDSPEKHIYNYGNLVRVKEYTGETDDDELIHLQKYLLGLSNAENIRCIEKRYWRSEYNRPSLYE